MRRWLDANPDDDLAPEIRARLISEPERYAAYTRDYLGWGVFALMAREVFGPQERPMRVWGGGGGKTGFGPLR
jgi:hypothetical protein